MSSQAPEQRLLQDSLLRAADRRGAEVAVGAGESRCTYTELLDRSLRLACGLQELGLERGDRVAVVMANSVPCVISMLGTLLAGGVFVVLGPETKEDRLASILSHSGARVAIGDKHSHESLTEVTRRTRTVESLLLSGVDGAALPFDEVVERSAPEPKPRRVIPLDLAALVYTSGTTGEPKGVMMTHENLVFLAGGISEYLRMSERDRVLSVLSLAHTYGLSQLIVALRLGATLHLERSFVYLAQSVRLIETEGITTFPGVPTVFAMLLSIHGKSPLSLERVERVMCAGGALLPSFLTGLREIFPNALIFPMYGLTECMRGCYLEPELVTSKPASVGRGIPGSETMVLGSDGTPVAPGEAGILHIRGQHVMPGYWNDPALTAEMLVDGPRPGERMLRTGDYFSADEEGFLYFVGRSDEIIKTRGEKVSPVEVENVLYGISGVREAAVVGVPDDLLGHAVRAFVALEADAGLAELDMIAECKARLEPFKVPRDVIVLEELPKTATGKIRKADLPAP